MTPASASSVAVFRAQEFEPRRWLRNGHLQTIAGNFLPRRFVLPAAAPLLVEVEGPAANHGPTMVLCECHWQPAFKDTLTVVLVHGLEGSSRSQYILGNAARAWAAGLNVVRMNMRSCGGTEEFAPTIYHSGRSEDVAAVVAALIARGCESIALAGYSMGANLVLKYAGEVSAPAPGELKAVAGISPLMDLSASSSALHEWRNRIYERRFLRAMTARIRRKAALFPAIYTTEGLEAIGSMRDFDGAIVARYGGFRDAEDYYTRVASSRFASHFSVPTLIVHSLDDPFIRMLPSTRTALLANPRVTYVETAHGGHCAFLAPPAGYDGYWAEKTLLDYLLATAA